MHAEFVSGRNSLAKRRGRIENIGMETPLYDRELDGGPPTDPVIAAALNEPSEGHGPASVLSAARRRIADMWLAMGVFSWANAVNSVILMIALVMFMNRRVSGELMFIMLLPIIVRSIRAKMSQARG